MPSAALRVQSASLPGRRSLRVADLRAISFSWRRLRRSSACSMTKSSSLSACRRISGQPMVEVVAHRLLDEALRVGGGELVLGLALEFRLADEDRQHGSRRRHHVVGGDAAALLRCRRARHGSQARSARCAGPVHACRPRASGWCCNRNGRSRRLGVQATAHSTAPCAPVLPGAAGEESGCTSVALGHRLRQKIEQAAGEIERRLLRHVLAPRSSALAHVQRISTPRNR